MHAGPDRPTSLGFLAPMEKRGNACCHPAIVPCPWQNGFASQELEEKGVPPGKRTILPFCHFATHPWGTAVGCHFDILSEHVAVARKTQARGLAPLAGPRAGRRAQWRGARCHTATEKGVGGSVDGVSQPLALPGLVSRVRLPPCHTAQGHPSHGLRRPTRCTGCRLPSQSHSCPGGSGLHPGPRCYPKRCERGPAPRCTGRLNQPERKGNRCLADLLKRWAVSGKPLVFEVPRLLGYASAADQWPSG
jgi:hypothetical protein